MKIINKIFVFVSFGVFFYSCGPDTKNDVKNDTVTTSTVPVKPHITPPDFNSDSAYTYIKAQADMGPRVPGTKAHEKCVAYTQAFFKSCGAEVSVQGGEAMTFDNKKWRIDNIVASLNPKAKNRILLCSHYDSRPFADKDPKPENRTKPCPGVNDGASGVGVLMEIARVIKNTPCNVGIDIVLFDLEDYGDNGGDPNTWCLGSQDWAKNKHNPAKFGVLLDMVGAGNATFLKEGVSVFFAAEALNKVWSTGQRLNYGAYFINEECQEMTDDHAFINKIAQIPCIDILHYDASKREFFEHHHTTTDDINTIDKKTLKAVGQTLLEVIYNEE